MIPGAKPQALLPVTSQGSVGCSLPPPHLLEAYKSSWFPGCGPGNNTVGLKTELCRLQAAKCNQCAAQSQGL